MKRKIPVLYYKEVKEVEKVLTNPEWFNLVVGSFSNPHGYIREGNKIYIPKWLRVKE